MSWAKQGIPETPHARVTNVASDTQGPHLLDQDNSARQRALSVTQRALFVTGAFGDGVSPRPVNNRISRRRSPPSFRSSGSLEVFIPLRDDGQIERVLRLQNR